MDDSMRPTEARLLSPGAVQCYTEMASHEYLAKFLRLVGPSVRVVYEKVNLVTAPTLRNFTRQLEVTVQYSTHTTIQ